MNGNFQISKDGTIFEIKEDGTIKKIATIQNGRINGISEIRNKGKGVLWFFMIIFAIATIILAILYVQSVDDYMRVSRRYDSVSRELSSIKSDLSSVKSELSTVKSERDNAQQNLADLQARVKPLVINEISIANKYKGGKIETDYGSTIYSSSSMYLSPKITYYGYKSGEITLYVKLYQNGYLRTGKESPNGYSYSDSEYIYSGENTCELSGWGGEEKGHWPAGSYRFEVWYNNSCLKSSSFTIY